MKKIMLLVMTLFMLLSCTNNANYLYGNLNTKDLVSSTKLIELKYVFLDEENNKIYENKVPVSLINTFKIKKIDSAKKILIYISQSKSNRSNLDPFVMDNIYINDLLEVYDNKLPEIIISSPVQLEKYDDTSSIFSWKKVKNADYYRIDFQKNDNDIFDALFFIPKNSTSFDYNIINNADELQEFFASPDFIKKAYFLKSNKISLFDLNAMRYLQITAFKLCDKKSMQLTLPSKKYIINRK